MTIAIDINDILRDTSGQFLKIYKKYKDTNFELDEDGFSSFNKLEVFPFKSEEELFQFKYIDYPYELFGRAEVIDNQLLPYIFNDWYERTLRNLDEENIPHVILFSPFELGISIQSTLSFLSKNTFRVREFYFPTNSLSIYDRADIVITCQPSLIEECPEDKFVFKIKRDYNKDIETKYEFNSLIDLIKDENNTLVKILENKIQ